MKIIDLKAPKTGYIIKYKKDKRRVQWHNYTRTWVNKSDIDGIKFEVVR